MKVYRECEIPKYKLETSLYVHKSDNGMNVNTLDNLYKHLCRVFECNDGVISKEYIEQNVQRTFVF